MFVQRESSSFHCNALYSCELLILLDAQDLQSIYTDFTVPASILTALVLVGTIYFQHSNKLRITHRTPGVVV